MNGTINMKKVHLVTGGTGFVGLGLILELLRQSELEIVCLVRPGKEPADARLYRLLQEAARAYEYEEEIVQAIPARCSVLQGDVRQEHCGVFTTLDYSIEQFWHVAASLRYEPHAAQEIFATNVEGTKHALNLARHGRAGAFNYISTAYVAGKRTGKILELIESGQETNNFYEKSKIQAEAIVYQTTDFPIRIFRPSVIIGHSKTQAVVGSFTGLYGLMRRLYHFRETMNRLHSGMLQEKPMRIQADPDVRMNLIPLDLVVTQAVQCATSASNATIFHLTNATPPSLGLILQLMFRAYNLPEPLFVMRREEMEKLDAQFNQGIDFYSSYMIGNKQFDRTHTDSALGVEHAGDCILDEERLLAFLRWYQASFAAHSGVV
jgi:thioester reductase-like protein